MQRGTIKKLFSEKGFGFIAREGKPDIFLHISGMVDRGQFDNLEVGTKVEFEETAGDKGPRAAQVRVA